MRNFGVVMPFAGLVSALCSYLNWSLRSLLPGAAVVFGFPIGLKKLMLTSISHGVDHQLRSARSLG